MLDGSDGAEHGQSVDSGLDVGRRAEFVSQHFADARNLIPGRNDERDHARAVPATNGRMSQRDRVSGTRRTLEPFPDS